MKFKNILTALLFFFAIAISQSAFSQTNYADVKVDDLTDTQIRQLMQRAESAAGLLRNTLRYGTHGHHALQRAGLDAGENARQHGGMAPIAARGREGRGRTPYPGTARGAKPYPHGLLAGQPGA